MTLAWISGLMPGMPGLRKNDNTIIAGALLASDGLILLLLAVRIATSNVNHWGLETSLLSIPMVLSIAWAVIESAVTRKISSINAFLLVVALLSLASLWLADRLNILVPYEAWLRRGMPERPF